MADEHSSWLSYLKADPIFDLLRTEPRFSGPVAPSWPWLIERLVALFQLADTLEEFCNLPITLLEAGVDLFSPLVHSITPAAPGLKQSSMTIEAGGLSVVASPHFIETLVDSGEALLHEGEERFPHVIDFRFQLRL